MDIEKHAGKRQPARREFLKTAALAGAVSAVGDEASAAGKTSGGKRSEASKGLEYTGMVIGMVRDLLAESSERIAAAADICAGAVSSGKKVYYTVRGHNEPLCILENRPGKPAFLLPDWPEIDPETFEPGDALITERINFCAPAKERGVRLIGILMPFQPQKKQGQGIVHVDYPGPWMEEICDVCIWDRTPYTVGTMTFDQLPVKAVPAHGALDGIILNLILAGTIDRLTAKGIPVKTEG
ncbi:MAG: twin-arginine translocation signal domain-containing protein [Candidatus Latescibacterota bacterium]